MPAITPNPLQYLVDQARQNIVNLEDQLAEDRATLQRLETLMRTAAFNPSHLQELTNLGGGIRLNELRRQVPQLVQLIATKRTALADLERQAEELDRNAATRISEGTDPNAAYSQELQKLQAKATLLTVLKWAGIIAAALLVLWVIRRTFTRIVKA